MSNRTDFTLEKAMRSSAWGIAGGVVLDAMVYPIEVLKLRQQSSQGPDMGVYRIARTIFQQEGIHAFYKGLPFQLTKTVRQAWCWPMIAGVPVFLERYPLSDVQRSALTGGLIASTNAALIPLERAHIKSACTGKSIFSLQNVMKDGWRGISIYGAKLYIGWITFLTAQQYFRDRSGIPPEQALPLSKAAEIGAKAAVVQSVILAPFDYMNTQQLANNRNPSHLLSRKEIFKLYRGWPLNACSLTIKNIALAILIDEVKRRTCKKSDSTLP